jgi:phage terminase Nu1 subunit (DNA packaging protein)
MPPKSKIVPPAGTESMPLITYSALVGNRPDVRTLRDWVEKGYLTRPARGGRGDIWVWTKEIFEHYRSRITEGEDELRLAKIRSENARAQKMELQIEETEGTLVKAADVVATWSSAFNVCKNRFMGLAVTLADDLAGVTDKTIAKEIIQDAIEEILEELGSGGIVNRSTDPAEDISTDP